MLTQEWQFYSPCFTTTMYAGIVRTSGWWM